MIDHCIGISTTEFSQFNVIREIRSLLPVHTLNHCTQASQFQFAAMEAVETLYEVMVLHLGFATGSTSLHFGF